MMSKEELLSQARTQGYRPEILEKVYYLLGVLEQLLDNPFLRERLVLKGGTALNLFCFDAIPRLSVDIDLNYIGSTDRAKMLEEKPVIQNMFNAICAQNGFELDRNPANHAGGKIIWRYPSHFGHKGNLEIDVNYMYRTPILPACLMKPQASLHKTMEVPILDIHELAAGKLSALFSRTASRDLFDAHYLLTQRNLDLEKLKLVFSVYLAISDTPLSAVGVQSIQYDVEDMKNRLFPVLKQTGLPSKRPDIVLWADKIIGELHQELNTFLPLRENEIEFVKLVREFGQVKPGLITKDENLWPRIESHPGILWAMKRDKENNRDLKNKTIPVRQKKRQ